MIPTLSELEMLARNAGKILLSGYTPRPGNFSDLEVTYKGPIDLVTDIDLKSETYLLTEISNRYPGHRIVSEENGLSEGADESLWLIDPLDGTINFAHGIPIFCVSLAFVEAGQIRLGVVYDPLRDECFSGERGQGSWLNGELLHTAASASLDHSLLVTGFPYNIRTAANTNLGHYADFSLRSMGVRRLGSAALDLCYVASGRFDGYWEISINAWDVAAGILIAEEAGARVTKVDGSTHLLTAPLSIVAANPTLHPQILEILNLGVSHSR